MGRLPAGPGSILAVIRRLAGICQISGNHVTYMDTAGAFPGPPIDVFCTTAPRLVRMGNPGAKGRSLSGGMSRKNDGQASMYPISILTSIRVTSRRRELPGRRG